MDLLYFLQKRLNFIESLYSAATGPFEEIKRKIKAGEPPYVDRRNPEYVDEPAFLDQWQEADDAVMVIGNWCLCMIQLSLQACLRETISPLGSLWWNAKKLQKALPQVEGKNWFLRYQALFLDELGIDWKKAPIDLADVEQLNLTRNDLLHNVDMLELSVARNKEHAKRFPVALFTDEMWAGLPMERIKINSDQLHRAIGLVRDFCTWLEDFRCNYPRRINVE